MVISTLAKCLKYTAWRKDTPTQTTISPDATLAGPAKPFHLKCQRPLCSRELSRLAFDSTPHCGLLEGRPFLSTDLRSVSACDYIALSGF
jgi:hypothetical protein